MCSPLLGLRNMTRDEITLSRLKEGTLLVDPKTGRIFTRAAGRNQELIGRVLESGYRRIALVYRGVTKNVFAHRIVWMASNGPIPKGMHIDHINRDKLDNRLTNLRIVTPKENRANQRTPRRKYEPCPHCAGTGRIRSIEGPHP